MAQVVPSGKLVREGQQSQSIAYSLDEGITWTTHEASNPVILNPPEQYKDQYKDFRDPFLFWHDDSKKWVTVISLAQLRKILIYTSSDLKTWVYVSEFGPVNAVGGVWECPSIFPLPLNGDKTNVKWIAQIGLNPGGPPGVIGSGTQYLVGGFNGSTFTADPDNVYPAPTMPKESVIFQDFESSGSFADSGWIPTGDLIEARPANGTLTGQQTVTGYLGNRLLNTFLKGDSTTGTLTSPSFKISHKYINFLIGGGYAPNKTCIDLEILGKVVRTSTGENREELSWHGWDVGAFMGQSAVIRIIDLSTDGWGHITVDAISFSDTLARIQEANWVDWGPDFYAALTFNGLSPADRVDIAWMNNWQYGAVIPTSPWRSAMSIPRKLSLKTINGKATLVHKPLKELTTLESSHRYSRSWDVVQEGSWKLDLSGKALNINLSFSDRSPMALKSPQFVIALRASSSLAHQTRVGYDFTSKQIFVDRTLSGDIGFDSTFPATYFAPLTPDKDGKINMRILLDWSSIEIFGGAGETTISAQIFPPEEAIQAWLFSTDGNTKKVKIVASGIESAWN